MPQLDLATILNTPDDPPRWLLHGVIGQGQMVILAGEPGVGKSVLSYTLALAVGAGGLPFLGRATSAGPVMYFDEENSLPDVKQYIRWAWRGLGGPDAARVKVGIEHFSLAVQGARRYEYMVERAGAVKPALIIIDTVTPACHIKDENDNAEASRAIAALRRVRTVAGPDCTMLLLKHARIPHRDATQEDGARASIRGAKTWLGELDCVLYHVASPGRPTRDGLRGSRIVPDKVRAFGLRHSINIHPSWSDQTPPGLILEGRDTD